VVNEDDFIYEMTGVKAGGGDDAIHVATNPYRTLCGLRAVTRNVTPLENPLPDSGSGCWSCLEQVAKWWKSTR
jgi:hypothetical protein